MVSAHLARTIVGGIGNAISFGLFASPIPTFYKIYKKGAVEDYSPNPYLVTVLNCALWIYYGMLHPDSLLIITINGIGLAMEIAYVIFYLVYATKQQRWSVGYKAVGEGVLFLLLVLLLSFVPIHKSQKLKAIGGLCDAVNILMYAIPCEMLLTVYRTNSVEYMPFWLSFAGFLNGAFWLTYGLIPFDVFLVVSNGSGFAFGIFQLCFYAFFYFKYPELRTNNKIVDEKAGKIDDKAGKVADMV